ncbi:unnamed protein product, partial [Mesorhabditis spiculigera]
MGQSLACFQVPEKKPEDSADFINLPNVIHQ